MTSVFYEDIKLSDSSVKSIEKCEIISQSTERIVLDKRRKELLLKVSSRKEKLGLHSVYQR